MSLLKIDEKDSIDKIIEDAHEIFVRDLKDRKDRPLLQGKFIYVNLNPEADGKENAFWHICSIGADDTKFDSYPCYNDMSFRKCKYLCEVDHEDNFLNDKNSIPCIYRAIHLPYVKELIEMVNGESTDPCLKVWETTNKKTKEKTFCIRYECKENGIDYVVIFEKKKSKTKESYYVLKTAFPVCLKSYKRRFNREYNNYKEKKTK